MNKTILLTTHDMDDIEQLCERVIVINHGKLAYDGSIPELRARIGLPSVIRATFRGPVQAPRQADADTGGVGLPFTIAERSADGLTIHCNRQETTAMDVLRILSQWGDVDDMHMEEPDFEEVINRIY